MKIAYVTHARFPTEKAHGHQIARVCEALVHLRHDVTVVAPDVHSEAGIDHTRYYHLKQRFNAERLPTFDALHAPLIPGRFAFLFTMRSYRGSLKKFFADNRFDLLYARSPQVVPALLSTGMPVVLELHKLPKFNHSRFAALCRKCALVVCLTTPMRDELVVLGVPKKKVIVEGDAVDPGRFTKLPSAKKARHHFGIPEGRPVIGYVGSLVTMDRLQKGVDILIKAVAHLNARGPRPFLFVVGGPKDRIRHYRIAAIHAGLTDRDFLFYGPVRSQLVPDAIVACDVCVYPAPVSKNAFFRRDTSPLKLFEYLAAGRPVVCADIPPIHDVLSSSVVRFVHPGSVASLSGGIRDVLEHPADAKKRVTAGLKLIKQHTWEKRMQRILDHLPATSGRK